MRCQSCGFENRAGAAYCQGCRAGLTRPCGACGQPVPLGVPHCPSCGAATAPPPDAAGSPTVFLPFGDIGAPAGPGTGAPAGPPPPGGGPEPGAYSSGTVGRSARGRGPDGELTGVVRDFQQRREQWGNDAEMEIWHFRIERYDESGNKLAVVPVEMRGFSFVGSVSNGDHVHVRGRWRDGTLRVDELANLTTRARVRGKSYRTARAVAVVLFVLIALAIVTGIVSLVLSGCNADTGPPPGWPTLPPEP
ncbi:zinc ribbon domain-containing protein [Streptomyces sp. NPDC088090]|uniref:double zinc ribbon domain-containing protein n=1 Tax=Streptomyces sp. NPDC088090 TaxID=3365822 RepID=UPI00385008DD